MILLVTRMIHILIMVFAVYLFFYTFNHFDDREVEKIMLKYENKFDYSKYTKEEIRKAIKKTYLKGWRNLTANSFCKKKKCENIIKDIKVVVPDEIKDKKSLNSTQSVDCKTYGAKTGRKLEKIIIKGDKYKKVKNFVDIQSLKNSDTEDTKNIQNTKNKKNLNIGAISNYEENVINNFEENTPDIIDYNDKKYLKNKDEVDTIKSEESILKKILKNKRNDLD